jgi:hypothetical protein
MFPIESDIASSQDQSWVVHTASKGSMYFFTAAPEYSINGRRSTEPPTDPAARWTGTLVRVSAALIAGGFLLPCRAVTQRRPLIRSALPTLSESAQTCKRSSGLPLIQEQDSVAPARGQNRRGAEMADEAIVVDAGL